MVDATSPRVPAGEPIEFPRYSADRFLFVVDSVDPSLLVQDLPEHFDRLRSDQMERVRFGLIPRKFGAHGTRAGALAVGGAQIH